MAIIKLNSSLGTTPSNNKKFNIQKFLPSNTKAKPQNVVAKGSDDLREELLIIKNKVIDIEKLLSSTFIFQRNINERTRRREETDRRSRRERDLEKTKTKIGNFNFPAVPKFGFIDAIKRFIFFTFLGIAFPKLLEIAPKIIELGRNLYPAVKFFGEIGKTLASSLVTFIDWGYKIRDNTEKVAKQIGGEKFADKFNQFNRSLNTFIDLSILAGLTALDVGLDAEKFRKKQLGKEKPQGPRRVGVTEGRGGAEGLGRRAAVTTGRGGARGLGSRATVTTGGNGKPPGWWNKIFKGPFAKLKGPLSKFSGAVVPGLGAAVGAADAAARFRSGDNVGGTLASISATLDALTAGSAILAATGIGAAVPAAFATVSMGIDVVLLIRDIIRAFFPGIPMFAGGGRIKLMASGGRVGSAGRSIKVSRKRMLVGRPQETRPGKDVGGKQQILKLFPDGSPENIRQTTTASPWWARLFGLGNQSTTTTTTGKRPSPYKSIENTSKILKKIPIPFVSALMGAASDLNLGQKPDKNLGGIVGGSIGKLVQEVIDNNVQLSFSDIVKFMSGYANGGDIRTGNIMKENDIGFQVGKMISKFINDAISSRVDEAVTGILREITGQGRPPEGPVSPADGGDYSPDVFHGMGPERMWNFFKNKGLSDFAVAGILGNADTESDFNPTIKNPTGKFIGLFQWDKDVRWPALVKWAQQNNLDPWAFDTQLKYAWHELQTSENATLAPLKAATSASEAAEIWRREFERGPGDPEGRKKDAEKWYKQYKGRMYIPPSIPGVIPGGVPRGNILGKNQTTIVEGGFRLRPDAAAKYLEMKAAAKRDGVNLTLTSAWRDSAEQAILYQRYLNGTGNLAAPPGSSNHERGISIDLRSGISWAQKNCTRFGWSNTGMTFSQKEPWHFDFVGGRIQPSPPQQPSLQPPQQRPQPPQQRPPSRPPARPSSRGPTGAVTGYGKVDGSEYFYANGKYWQRSGGQTKEISEDYYAAIRTNFKEDFGLKYDVNPNTHPLPSGRTRNPQHYKASISTPNQNQIAQGLDTRTSYEEEGTPSFVAIQIVNRTQVVTT